MSDKSSLAVFDLNSQTGIRLVLATIRQSELPASEKNELKDLVLLYTSGGADESVRISLEQKLNSHGLKPTEIKVDKPKETKATKPRLPFGSSRPLPSFSSSTTSFSVDNKEETEHSKQNVDDVKKVEPVIDNSEPKKTSFKSAITETKVDSKPNAPQTGVGQDKKEASKNDTIDNTSPKTDFSKTSQPQKPAQGNVISINRDQRPKTSASVGLVDTPITGKEQTEKPEILSSRKENDVVFGSKTFSNEKNTDKPQSPISPTVPPKTASTTSPTATKHLNRIREIKSAVNKKVGNPVNLVDIDNQIGREYMNALLEAMKRLSTEGLALDQAMERLEQAYLAVEKAVSEKNQTDELSGNDFKPNESRSSISGFDRSNDMVTTEDEASEQAQNFSVDKITPKTTNFAYSNDGQIDHNNQLKVNRVQSPTQEREGVSAFEKPNPQPLNQDVKVDNLNASEVTKPVSTPNQPPVPPQSRPQSQSTEPVAKRVTSLAEEARNLTPEDLPKTKNTSAEAVGNPLYAPEVDAGLEQLLSDWPLFKKSGLFGTGPKGSEHPLFKKIANLQIPVLLAGRFEGANQEIRQSITDYMNGWRYEQGIIYEQGETFELYLRRVIKHILDAQKQRRPA